MRYTSWAMSFMKKKTHLFVIVSIVLLLGSSIGSPIMGNLWSDSRSSQKKLFQNTGNVDYSGKPHMIQNQNYYTLTEPTHWGVAEYVNKETENEEYCLPPNIAVDQFGNTHIVWAEAIDYNDSGDDHDIFYRYKSNGGSWGEIEVVSTESTEDSYFAFVAIDENRTVHVAWADYTNINDCGNDRDVFYKKKPINGSWNTNPTELVTINNTLPYYKSPSSLAVDEEGNTHITWYGTNYGDTYPSYIRYSCKPYGSSWLDSELVSTDSNSWVMHASMALGPSGTIHVAWNDYSNNPPEIRYKMKFYGGNWPSSYDIINTEGNDYWGPGYNSLAVDSDSTVHIVWGSGSDYGGSGDDNDIFYRYKSNGNDWGVIDVVSTGSTYGSWYPLICVDNNKALHVMWLEHIISYDDIVYTCKQHDANWPTGSLTAEMITIEEKQPDDSYYFSMAVDKDGIPHIAWLDELEEYQDVNGIRRIYYKSRERPSDMCSGTPSVMIPIKPDIDEDITDVELAEDQVVTTIPQSGLGLGDALHVEPTTGNVYTSLRICPGFTIHYNSLNIGIRSILGYGWTYGNYIYLIDTMMDGKDPMIVDGHGTVSIYLGNKAAGYICPPQRKANLYYEGDRYVLRYFDGSVIEFNEDPAPSGLFFIKNYTDSHGKKTKFIYNESSSLLKWINISNDQTIELGYYEGTDYLAWVKHPNGAITTFEYDDDNMLHIVTDPFGKYAQYSYDWDIYYGECRLLKNEKLKNSQFYRCDYDDLGDPYLRRAILDSKGNILVEINCSKRFPRHRPTICSPGKVNLTDGNGYQWSIARNEYGQVNETETPVPENYITTYEYYESGNGERMLKQITYPKEQTTSYTYDDKNNLKTITDANENTVEYKYENDNYPGLPTERIRGSRTWHYDYNEFGLLKKETDPLQHIIKYDYDYYQSEQYGRRIKTITITDQNDNITQTTYDEHGRITSIITADSINDPPLTKTTYTYEVFDGSSKKIRQTTYRYYNPMNMQYKTYVIDSYYDCMNQLIKEQVDPEGLNLVTRYEYDGMGNLIDSYNPKNVRTNYTYDHRGRLETVTEDKDGDLERTTIYTYDDNSNIKTITDPEGGLTQYIYNSQNQLDSSRDAAGYITRYKYDPNGNLECIARGLIPDQWPQFGIQDPDSRKIEYYYDNLDRVYKIIQDSDCITFDQSPTTWIQYVDGFNGDGEGSDNNLIYKVTDPTGNNTFYHYNDLERLTTIVKKVGDQNTNPEGDADDASTSYLYDPVGNLKQLTGPEGETIEYWYDAANRLTFKVLDPQGEEPLVWKYDYDHADLRSITQPNGNIVNFFYDDVGRQQWVFDSIGLISYSDYDATNNIIHQINGLEDHEWQYEYDNHSRLTKVIDPTLNQTLYDYDFNDNLLYVTDANNIKTQYIYNALGWPIRVIDNIQGTDDTSYTVTVTEYNGAGEVTKVIDSLGGTTKYFYDALGNHIQTRYSDDPFGFGNDHTTSTYDKIGNLKTYTDQNGDTTTYDYNDLYQLTHIHHPEKDDQPAYTDYYEYDRSDRMTFAYNPFAYYSFDYDTLGRLKTQQQSNRYYDDEGMPVYTDPFTTTYDYHIDETSEIIITYPGADAQELAYRYDLRNRPQTTTSDELEVTYDLNNADEIDAILYGDNAIQLTVDHDPLSRIKSMLYEHQRETLWHEEYGYDAIGNRLYTNNLHDPGNSELYSYDERNRLRGMERGILNEDKDDIESFTESPFLKQWQFWDELDANGNWRKTTEQWADTDIFSHYFDINLVNEYITYFLKEG